MGQQQNDKGVDRMLSGGVLPEIVYSDLEFYECLSSGTYGTVYRAKYLPHHQIVAVKRVLVLEKEAHVLSLLRHKNIIQFYGAVTHPPNFCIVLEYASKGSLYAYLADSNNKDLDFSLILRWATEIATGVNYLHTEAPVKMIHRDIKSKNVVISVDDTCKLCDFGTSKAIMHTTQMSVVGTIAWMSPEMIQSLPVSESTDTWSYAVILWELLTRQVPFKNLEAFRIAWMVVEENVRLVIPSSCPAKFADIMRDSWNKDPKLRPIFVDILRRLQEIKRDKSVSSEVNAFLNKKQDWKREIDDQLDILKQKERELTDREAKLFEWESRLTRRERNIENSRRLSAQLNYDVNTWHEDDVIVWINQLSLSSNVKLNSSLIELFRDNHINGQRLLMLTDNDLRNLGVNSVGYRRQILSEIEHLAADNLRLINFPPLEIAAKSPKSVDRALTLTLLFGVYVRIGLSLNSHKWKLVMDIDDADGCDDANALISEVRFVVQNAPYVYKVTEAPFVMRDWATGFTDDMQVQCIVTFSDLVRKPRNTKFFLDIDYDTRGTMSEKSVDLHIKTPSVAGNSRYSRSSSIASVSTLNSNLHSVHSSPVLQGAWTEKTFRDALPLHVQKPITPQKSPLWAQIVAGLKLDEETLKPLPRNNSDPSSLGKNSILTHDIVRTVSDEPTSQTPSVSFYLGGKSKSVDETSMGNDRKVKIKSSRQRTSGDTRPKYLHNHSPVRLEQVNRRGRRGSNKLGGTTSPTTRRSSSSDGEESSNIPQFQNQVQRTDSAGYYSQTSYSPEIRQNSNVPSNLEHRRSLPVDFSTKRPQILFQSGISFDRTGTENILSPVLERHEFGHHETKSTNDTSAGKVGNKKVPPSSKRRRTPTELSSTSIAVHGGNPKLKWKG